MWFFYSPNIIYGEDALDFLEKVAEDKCFIVTDNNLEELGLVKILTDKLEKWGKQYEIFTARADVESNEEDILKGKEPCISYSPNTIIALGGGSVIDTTKGIWALYEFPEFNVEDITFWKDELYDLGKKAKMIAIPTTSGTGSDATWAIVTSRILENIETKFETAHRGLVPDFSILDPIFPAKMPPKLTVGTGFDVLAHSIEGLVSSWRNEFSEAMCLKAIELVFKYLPIAYKEPNNMEARDFMHQAATMAGLGFGNGQAHIGHSMGHALGAILHVPHGNAVGVCLPYVTQFCINNPDETDKTIEILGNASKKLGLAKWADDNNKAANILVNKIKEIAKEIDFAMKLKDLGIQREDLDKNLDQLILQCFRSACTTMSPRSPNFEDFKRLFIYAYEGKDIDF